jgi:hypothetical protein
MAKYNVIGAKREYEENGEKKVAYDPIELVSTVGMAKGKTFKWDPGSEVTEKQVADDIAKQLVEAGQLEVVEAPASWSKPVE